jgi:hypothetical protein
MLLELILFSFNIYEWNRIQFSQNAVFPQCHAWPLTILPIIGILKWIFLVLSEVTCVTRGSPDFTHKSADPSH